MRGRTEVYTLTLCTFPATRSIRVHTVIFPFLTHTASPPYFDSADQPSLSSLKACRHSSRTVFPSSFDDEGIGGLISGPLCFWLGEEAGRPILARGTGTEGKGGRLLVAGGASVYPNLAQRTELQVCDIVKREHMIYLYDQSDSDL